MLSHFFSYANLASSPGFPLLSWYFISLRKLEHEQVGKKKTKPKTLPPKVLKQGDEK